MREADLGRQTASRGGCVQGVEKCSMQFMERRVTLPLRMAVADVFEGRYFVVCCVVNIPPLCTSHQRQNDDILFSIYHPLLYLSLLHRHRRSSATVHNPAQIALTPATSVAHHVENPAVIQRSSIPLKCPASTSKAELYRLSINI